MPLGTEVGFGPGQVVLYRDLSGGAGFPSNTMLPGPTPTFVLSQSSASQRYNLRHRPHLLQLPSHTTRLSDSNFVTRMLYKDKY